MSDERDEKLSVIPQPRAAGDLDRRLFLKVLGAAFSTALLPDVLSGCGVDTTLPQTVTEVEALTARQTISVVRPEDHLVLTLGFVNLKRSPAGQLVKVTASLPAFIIVDFPAQSIVEDAATGSSSTISAGFFASAWLSGGTRLIFQLPDAYVPVPYSLSAVLGLCSTSSVVVADPMKNTIAATVGTTPTAASVPALIDGQVAALSADTDPAASARKMVAAGTLAAIAPYQNAYAGSAGKPAGFRDGSVSVIEAPYRLQLSPNTLAGWAHAASPVQGRSGATELWHTALGARTVGPTVAGTVDTRNAYLRTVRALSTRDDDLAGAPVTWSPAPAGGSSLLNPSLSPAQRSRIVTLSSGAAAASPIQVNRLLLSSLGAYLDAHGEWNDSTVASWVHRMTGGRESYVQVVQTGVLLPFGNVATRIIVTKRNDDASKGPVGALVASDVFVVRNPVTSYRSGDFTQQGTRDTLLTWPFVTVELTQTYFVAQRPANADPVDFWPVDMSGSPMMVPAIGRDQRGRAIHFSVPFYFAGPGSSLSAAVDHFRSALAQPPIAAPRTTAAPSLAVTAPPPNGAHPSLDVAMGGQRIAYAYSRRDDTTFATRALYLDVAPVSESGFPYVPVVTGAILDVEAVQPYTNGAPVTVTYHPRYATGGAGFDTQKNASQLLFSLASAVTVDLRNRPDGGTAFLAPSMAFTALSRVTGPSHDPSVPALSGVPTGLGSAIAAVDGGFDPVSYLNLVTDQLDKIRVFGVFSLIDIVKAVDPGEAASDMKGLAAEAEQAALRYAPKFVTEGLNEVEKILSLVAEVKSEIESIWTNAKELLGSDYVEQIASAVDNPGATVSALVSGALARAESTPQYQAVKDKLTDIVTKAKVFYKTLLAAIQHIESFEILALAGSPPPPDGSLPQLITNGLALKNAIVDLASYGARAALDAKDAVRATVNQVVSSVPGARHAMDAPTFQVNNTPLQISQGLAGTFLAKMKDLESIVGDVSDPGATLDRITKLFDDAQQAVTSLRDLTVKIGWQPKIGSYYVPHTNWLVFRPATQHGLSLSLEARAKSSDTKKAGVDVTCRLDQFDLCLGPVDDQQRPVIAVQFDHVSFVALAGTKPDVDVKINGVVFGGVLSFLDTLRKIIPLDGFSDPPFLNVDAQGIHAGFSFHVPNVAIGIFSIENVSLSAKLEIPFFADGGPVSGLTLTFSFCDKDHPFLITVSMLGGGGYFVVTVNASGIASLEASISVGAQVAFSVLDIAQGSLSIMVSITFTVKDATDQSGNALGKDVSLTASLRLHGELDVCGIVSVAVDLNVGMTYDVTTGVMVAQGTITIDASLLLFSIHVDVPFRKEFHACNNDPTLRELMPPGVDNVSQYWTDYCNAYAA